MAASITGGITGVALCTALVMSMGYSHTKPQHNGQRYVPPAVSSARTTLPQLTPPPSTMPPKPPAPATTIPYYRNTTQSFYANIQGMLTANTYPGLHDKLAKLLDQPVATWLGEWLGNGAHVESTVSTIVASAAAAHQMPVVVSYNIPDRDLGQYSAGGLSDATAYASWIDSISKGIGDRPAIVILEPDALPGIYDMSQQDGDDRMTMLHNALKTFTTKNPKTYVYIDSGNSKWLQPSELVALLKNVYAGVDVSPRISLNVSNYRPTPELTAYFNTVNQLYGGNLKVLLDIGMNGAQTDIPTEDWCNPRAARQGTPDDAVFNPDSVIEQLMVRPLGESSGECERGDPAPGQFNQDLAATMLGQPSGQYKL